MFASAEKFIFRWFFAIVLAPVCSASAFAHGDDDGYWRPPHHHHHHHGWNRPYYGPVPPVYYAPAPIYVPPPHHGYYPAPRPPMRWDQPMPGGYSHQPYGWR